MVCAHSMVSLQPIKYSLIAVTFITHSRRLGIQPGNKSQYKTGVSIVTNKSTAKGNDRTGHKSKNRGVRKNVRGNASYSKFLQLGVFEQLDSDQNSGDDHRQHESQSDGADDAFPVSVEVSLRRRRWGRRCCVLRMCTL